MHHTSQTKEGGLDFCYLSIGESETKTGREMEKADMINMNDERVMVGT